MDLPNLGDSTIEVKRFFRSRDFHIAGSFGQGMFSSFDFRLFLGIQATSVTDAYDLLFPGQYHLRLPDTSGAINFIRDQGNIFKPVHAYRAEKLEPLTAQMTPASTGTTYSYYLGFPDAKFARLTNPDGSILLFELVQIDSVSGWSADRKSVV